MGAARCGVKISCDQRGNIKGTKRNLIFSTLHCTPRCVAIDRNMSTAVLYMYILCIEKNVPRPDKKISCISGHRTSGLTKQIAMSQEAVGLY